SYIRQKNANGHSKDELKLPQKRGPKNKRKSRLVPGESIQLRDITLYEPYHKVQIVKIIGDFEVIVDFILENCDKDQRIVQLANIIGYDDEQLKKNKGDECDCHFNKKHVCILPGSNYFETCLKQWKEPYIVSCGSEFKTKNGEKPKNIPMNAFRFDKYTSVETGKTKYLYICSGRATSTRQIDQQLPLILAINVTGISINEEGICFENKDLLEEISFPPDDEQKKQRYHLTGVSFCNSNHHVADIHFENIKNSGWYQYDGIGKTYRARAMHIGNARPPHRDGYVMNFVIYVKI
ncbi:hypothetical protein C2G38_2235799, partial [Gigaspora rosea]